MLSQIAGTSKYFGKSASCLISPGTLDTDHIPHIPSKYNSKFHPIYAAALSRSAEEFFAAENLDGIQLELENMLSKVALRYRIFKSEYDMLDKDEKRIERRSKQAEKQPSSPGKKKKEDPRKSKSAIPKLAKHKSSPIYSPPQSQSTDESVDTLQFFPQVKETKIIVPKNDTPNKFWLSVEPFCMPLTNEDLRLIDDLLDQYSGPLVPPIPDLGQHYSSTWTNDALREVKGNSNSSLPTSAGKMQRPTNILDDCVTGPLTQCLVSALIDEHFGNEFLNADSNSSSEYTNFSNHKFRPFSLMKNGIDIEKRLKKELVKQGILENEEFSKEGEDEILGEIKKLISELSAVSEYNSYALKRVRESAVDEINRLEIKRKLDVVDYEILETYKKTVVSRSKRKLVSTGEQQEVLRLASEQKMLSDKLESFL